MASTASLLAIRGFPGAREWWHPDDWVKVVDVARSVNVDDPPLQANLPTGFTFWPLLMAQFPQLREVNLRRVEGVYSKDRNRNILIQVPGRGEDIYLQQFGWAPTTGAQFDRPIMVAEDQRLFRCVFRCTGQICGDKQKRYVIRAAVKIALCFLCFSLPLLSLTHT